MKRIAYTLIYIVVSLAASAAEGDSIVRPVMGAYTVEAGTSHLVDTYLSPIKYGGSHFGLDYERRQAMRHDPRRFTMRLNVNLGLDRAHNRAGNSTMWGIRLRGDWGMARRWQVAPGLTVAVGGSTRLDAGCLYLSRNSNNPVAVKAAWTVNATGYVSYDTRVWRLPVTLTYQPTLPVAGAFFSPDYGELYYEIYLGDTSGLAHCAWWGNYRALDNQLAADLRLGATCLRLGYRCELLSTRVNNITSRAVSHAAVIGISGNWLSVGPRGVNPHATQINALY